MRIGELAAKSNLSRDTIRLYERMGLLHSVPSTSTTNKYRDYGPEALERIAFVQQAQTLGFTLAQIATKIDAMLSGTLPASEGVEIFSDQLAHVEKRLAELQTMHSYLAHKLQYFQALLEQESKK